MSLPNKNITLLPETKEFNGHTVQRIMAVKDFVIDVDCSRKRVNVGDIGGYVDPTITIQNSWVENGATVVGYNLRNSIIGYSCKLVYDGVGLAPIIESSCIATSTIRGFVNIFDSKILGTDIKTSCTFDVKHSDIESCMFDNTVKFSRMYISGYFECSYTGMGTNYPRFKLHDKKFHYSTGTAFRTHMIHELGSRDDNLFIFVIYDNLLPDITEQTPIVYVSTGCFCDTLDVFEKAVKDKYGNSGHCDEKYYYDT